jgi:hypothetical protein
MKVKINGIRPVVFSIEAIGNDENFRENTFG